MEFFSFGDGDTDFDKISLVEVEHEWHDGESLFVDLHVDLFDLFFV